MTSRTTDQKLAQEPEMVTLGDEVFHVKPLVISKARKFRKTIVDKIAKAGTMENGGDLAGLTSLVMTFFDKDLIELVGMAVPEFANKDKKWIEDNVTEADLQSALGVAVSINFPWLKKMVEFGSLGRLVNR